MASSSLSTFNRRFFRQMALAGRCIHLHSLIHFCLLLLRSLTVQAPNSAVISSSQMRFCRYLSWLEGSAESLLMSASLRELVAQRCWNGVSAAMLEEPAARMRLVRLMDLLGW